MINYKIFFGYLATVIALIGYIPYFWDVVKNRTKPHAFSWLVWAVLTGIAFAVQVVGGAGPGAWVTGFSTFACLIIFFLALKKGQRKFSNSDWISLVLAFMALVLWRLTNNPILSVILVTITDAFGFLPTFFKGYNKPFEETAFMFVLSSIKWIFAILALDTLSVVTWLYPASIIVMNGSFALLLFVRRKQLKIISS